MPDTEEIKTKMRDLWNLGCLLDYKIRKIEEMHAMGLALCIGRRNDLCLQYEALKHEYLQLQETYGTVNGEELKYRRFYV